MTPMTELLRQASQRLVRTVDSLPEPDWRGPSLLPRWSRSHVVAHLALNAEGLAGAVRGVVQGEPVPMYASQERRDADIEELAAASTVTVRGRMLAAITALADALDTLTVQPDGHAGTRIERTPGAQTFRAGKVPWMRLREVEIHHADLLREYSPADWPAEFAMPLLDERVRLLDRDGDSQVAATLVANDVGRTWQVGVGGPTVTGPSRGLAWWLTGRAPYPGLELSSEDGALPGIGAM